MDNPTVFAVLSFMIFLWSLGGTGIALANVLVAPRECVGRGRGISAPTSSANDRSDHPMQEDLSPPLETSKAAIPYPTILADSGTLTLNRDGKLSPEQLRQLGTTISLSRWLLYPLGAALAVVIILFGFLFQDSSHQSLCCRCCAFCSGCLAHLSSWHSLWSMATG